MARHKSKNPTQWSRVANLVASDPSLTYKPKDISNILGIRKEIVVSRLHFLRRANWNIDLAKDLFSATCTLSSWRTKFKNAETPEEQAKCAEKIELYSNRLLELEKRTTGHVISNPSDPRLKYRTQSSLTRDTELRETHPQAPERNRECWRPARLG